MKHRLPFRISKFFALYPSSHDSHKIESIMLQGQDRTILGKRKILKETPNDLGLTAKYIFKLYAPESSSCFYVPSV
jgi:hypothetical protein